MGSNCTKCGDKLGLKDRLLGGSGLCSKCFKDELRLKDEARKEEKRLQGEARSVSE